jgi:hypothetical protein
LVPTSGRPKWRTDTSRANEGRKVCRFLTEGTNPTFVYRKLLTV